MNESDLMAFLREHDFVSSPKHSIPEKGMGNSVDAYVSKNILIRIISDRGQKFIELARTGTSGWIDIFALVLSIDKSYKINRGSFSEAIYVLSHYWPRLAAAL